LEWYRRLFFYAGSDRKWSTGVKRMVDVTEISAIIAVVGVLVGVLVGVVYYVLEIRHQSRLRQTESLFRLSPWFNISAHEMQEAVRSTCSIEYESYDDYLKRYSEGPEDLALKTLGNYFVGIGILVSRKLVDAEIVRDFWGDIILSTWEQIKPIIADMRKGSGDRNVFVFWEYLYNEMKKREQHQ
jgi:hypothetical protein